MHPPYTPATDLSDQAAPLSESFEVPLLGVPVAYSSNSAAVIELAARALARWGDLPRTLVEVGPPARVAIVVHPPSPGEPALPQDEPFVCRAYGDTFLAAGGGNLLCAHLAAGSATAFVTPALIADELTLR
ncbi:MAG: hypothetical protein HGA45_20935, partial [Chloroflexales bacterium]|nr:hypothetical protein [Chloroflexales bacterium]